MRHGRARSVLVRVISATVLVSAVWVTPAWAQGSAWSQPVSVSLGSGFSTNPYVAVDGADRIHVLWSQNSTSVDFGESVLDTIYHAVLESGHLSEPVDVFAASDGGQALLQRVRFDGSQRLCLLWAGWPGLTYATADAAALPSAQAWRSTALSTAAFSADFALAPDGVVHLAYVADRAGIYYMNSLDGGRTWSNARTVWQVPASSQSSGTVRIEVSASTGTIHLAWDVTDAANHWNTVQVAYARSADGGATWGNTFTWSDDGEAEPAIGFDSGGAVHLIWNNPAGSSEGRGHAWSTDDGKTWETDRVFPGYRGRAGQAAMSLDPSGHLHLLFTANSPVQASAHPFYSVWSQGAWSHPEPLAEDVYDGESPALAVDGGGNLHAVWFSYGTIGYGVWYSRTGPAAELTRSAIPVPTPVSPITDQGPTVAATLSLDSDQVANEQLSAIRLVELQGRRRAPGPLAGAATGALVCGCLVLGHCLRLSRFSRP